jgi:hypothetical protein
MSYVSQFSHFFASGFGKLAIGVLMAAIIVAVDFLFFGNSFWERRMANAGIVLLFGAF